MSESFAIVIPAKNEEGSIVGVISDVRSHWPDVAIYVVNDKSTDNTRVLLEQQNVHCFNHLESMGAWKATQTGLLKAYSEGYDFVVSMDADGQHLATEINKLKDYLQNNPETDIVVGACTTRASFLQRAAWQLFKSITGIEINDITSGFRIYNKAAVAVLTSEQACLLEYQDVGVLLFLKSAGLKVGEVPVKMLKRTIGNSRIFSSWSKIAYYMISSLLLCVSKGAPEKRAELFKRLR